MNITAPKSALSGQQFCFTVTGCGPKLDVQLTGIPGAVYTIKNSSKPGVKTVCVRTPSGSKGFLGIRVGSGPLMDRSAVYIRP